MVALLGLILAVAGPSYFLSYLPLTLLLIGFAVATDREEARRRCVDRTRECLDAAAHLASAVLPEAVPNASVGACVRDGEPRLVVVGEPGISVPPSFRGHELVMYVGFWCAEREERVRRVVDIALAAAVLES